MGRPIKKGSTDQSTVIRIIDSTDFTPENAVEHNTAGIDLWWRREGETKTAITEAALAALDSAHSDGGIELIGDGYYRLDLPDAAVAAGAGENSVQVGGTVTGMIVIGNEHALVDYDPYAGLATSAKLLAYIQLLARSDSAIKSDKTTELGEINANEGSGAGDFDSELQSQEMIAGMTDDLEGRLTSTRAGLLDNLAEMIVHETTIASVTDDKTFTLTASGLDGDTSADDDAWNNASVVIEDVTGTAKELRTVEDYGGVAKQIILDRNCKFNLASGDKVRFFPSCTSNVVSAVIADSDKDDIADKVWDEADADHMTVGTKGLKIHHAGRGRY